MNNVEISSGNIFLIPFENQFAVCKIIWISKRTKNAFSFTIKDKLAHQNEQARKIAVESNNIKIKLFTGSVQVFYSSVEKLKNGEWKIIGNVELSNEETDNYLKHNIAGKLFDGDSEIRALKNEELKLFPKMLISGFEAVDNYLKIAFTKS